MSVSARTADFPYSLRIDTFRRYSIIRFPNDPSVFTVLTEFASRLPPEDYFSITRTARGEISVIQDAKYPTYPQGLDEATVRLIQVEEGFVLIEVVPDDAGGQIDFGMDMSLENADYRCDGAACEIGWDTC